MPIWNPPPDILCALEPDTFEEPSPHPGPITYNSSPDRQLFARAVHICIACPNRSDCYRDLRRDPVGPFAQGVRAGTTLLGRKAVLRHADRHGLPHELPEQPFASEPTYRWLGTMARAAKRGLTWAEAAKFTTHNVEWLQTWFPEDHVDDIVRSIHHQLEENTWLSTQVPSGHPQTATSTEWSMSTSTR